MIFILLTAMVPVQAGNTPNDPGVSNSSVSNSSVSTYIVVFKDTPQPMATMQSASSLITSYGGHVKHQYKIINGIAVTIPDSMAGQLKSLPNVKYVEKDQEVQVLLNDSIPQIGADQVWAEGYTGRGVKVAVIDTGIDASHPDLNKGKVVAWADFVNGNISTSYDDHGHGTHVASTIAGTGNASGGKYRGVAPNASIMSAKVLDRYGGGNASDIIMGMDWAVQNGAQVMSISLGTYFHSQALDDAVKRAVDKGVVVVIAAGNAGPYSNSIACPGDSPDAITVGAVDKNDTIAYFSSRGPTYDGRIKPDVTNVGVNVVAARASGTSMGFPVDQYYTSASGTSMATPMTSGVVALMLEKDPYLTPAQVKSILTRTAKPLNATAAMPNNNWGWGRVQAKYAVDNISAYDSFYVSDTIPGTMLQNQTSIVAITMLNTGIYDWSSANNTSLQGSLDASLYGNTSLTVGTIVHPGEQYTWSFPMTAPASLGNHTLRYQIYNDTNPFGYMLNKSVRVNSSIVPGMVQFNNSTYVALKSTGRATIRVDRINGLDNDVSVNYSVGGGNATLNVDYLPANGTLTFAQDQSYATFNLTLLGNYYYKGNMTLNLTLSNVTGGATLGNDTAVLTVIDNGWRPEFEIHPSSYTVTESQTNVTVYVYSFYNYYINVSVNYTVGGGNATPGVDYLPANGTLDFPSGQSYSYKTINVSILDDHAIGPDRTVNVTLSNPTNGSKLTYWSKSVITIKDNAPTYTYHLVSGWNLISVPVSVPNSSVSSFFPSNVLSNIEVIWGWNESIQNWVLYSPDPNDDFYKRYSKIDNMDTGRAYWVYMDSAANFTIQGVAPPSAPASPVSLVKAWNFVGPGGVNAATPTTLYPGTEVVWGWNESIQNWVLYSSDPNDDFYKRYSKITQIVPGHGYWVYMP